MRPHSNFKRNIELHVRFPNIPSSEVLMDGLPLLMADYMCTLKTHGAVSPGRLYLTLNRACFAAVGLAAVQLPFAHVAEVERKSTAKLIPNGIHVRLVDGVI